MSTIILEAISKAQTPNPNNLNIEVSALKQEPTLINRPCKIFLDFSL